MLKFIQGHGSYLEEEFTVKRHKISLIVSNGKTCACKD